MTNLGRLTVVTTWLMAAIVTMPASAAQDNTEQLLRERMERAMFQGKLSVGGVDLAAVDLLPKFYAELEFRPAWSDRAKIEQLYPLAQRAVAEGLDSADYPLRRVEDPFKLAELVMDNPETWSRSSFDDVLATRKTRTIHLAAQGTNDRHSDAGKPLGIPQSKVKE